MLSSLVKKIKSAPKGPGVYLFYKDKNPLYIGKASNLKNRLKSYLKIIDYKSEALHKEANRLKFIKLHSNIEALIVESRLIKDLKPKYNVLFKDDKNYFYIAVTKERLPRIFLTHQPVNQRITNKSRINEFVNSKKIRYSLIDYIGPFTDGRSLKAMLRLLRRRFPYCTCKPHLRSCLNAQIGNCLGYCCTLTNDRQPTTDDKLIKEYRKNITKIRNVLTGKDKKFIRQLKDPYELLVLEKIWEHEPYLEASGGQRSGVRREENKTLYANRYTLTASNVECYDNSHLSGKEAVGALTAWVKNGLRWEANKPMWRKFKIRGIYTEDDPRMMEEIVSRRLNHPEWPYPDLIIIDGGITQLNAAKRALAKTIRATDYGLRTKVISFAKPQQLVFGLDKKPVSIASLPEDFQKLIKLAIQNTHNFAIRYHRIVRKRKFSPMAENSAG